MANFQGTGIKGVAQEAYHTCIQFHTISNTNTKIMQNSQLG
jgi:hypothetical protein